MPKFLVLAVLALGIPIEALSQAAQPPCSAGPNAGAQSVAIMRTGSGAPYSLTAVIKTEWKLSDGNTLSGFMTSHQARDGQGRTRIDNPSYCAMDKDHQPHWQGSIAVKDPVAKTYAFWQEGFMLPTSAKIATVTHEPSLTTSNPPTAQQEYRMAQQVSESYDQASPQAKRYNGEYKVEDLGKRNIAGLEASGMRLTITRPPGAMGNSLPLINVEDKWISDEYGVILLDIKDDPVLGKSTYEVTSFTPGEPDASLFQPPAGYEIHERTVNQ